MSKVPPTPFTAIDRALPRLPEKVPEGLTAVATLDCGAAGLVGLCRWGGEAFMLVRVPPEGPDLTVPLTPLMTAADIHTLAEESIAGDQRLRTWAHLVNVLAMGVLVASLPEGPS